MIVLMHPSASPRGKALGCGRLVRDRTTRGRRWPSALTLALLVLASAGGCWSKREDRSRTEATAAAELVGSYPKSRWRLAQLTELQSTVVWVSHILIRYEGSSRGVPFTHTGWLMDFSSPVRSRAEARALALDIARQARESPEVFPALARRYSDDAGTREQGGRLGGVRASDLAISEGALDAISSLGSGEVSRVVSTPQGFSVFRRDPVPADEYVSGVHLVIGYRAAPWLSLASGKPTARSRDEALALAGELYSRIEHQPGRMKELIEQYSDHPDRVLGGDLGRWSLREPTLLRREIDALAHLAVGEVAFPVDSPLGISVVKRTPDSARERLAAEGLRAYFTPGDPASEAAAEREARAVMRRIEAAPAAFSALRKRHQVRGVDTWVRGRGEPALTALVAGMQFGEVGGPVREPGAYCIARRIEPGAPPARPVVHWEIPQPERVDLDVVVGRLPGSLLGPKLRGMIEDSANQLGLHAAVVSELLRLAARLHGMDGSRSDRIALMHELLDHADQTLGRQARPFRQSLESAFEVLLLTREFP